MPVLRIFMVKKIRHLESRNRENILCLPMAFSRESGDDTKVEYEIDTTLGTLHKPTSYYGRSIRDHWASPRYHISANSAPRYRLRT